MQIGIIGFGNFGQLLAKLLKKENEIFVANRSDKSSIAKEIGVKYVSASEAASKDIVIFSVPVSAMKEVLGETKGFVKSGSVIMDVCSVKEMPSALMKKMLPENVDIVATHPMFGPVSGRAGVAGFSVVVCPVRAGKENLEKIKNMFSRLGLKILTATPEEHDRQIAWTQALVHFIGMALEKLGAKDAKIKTPSFDTLMEMNSSIHEDVERISGDILKYNRYSKKMRDKFVKELMKINSKIG